MKVVGIIQFARLGLRLDDEIGDRNVGLRRLELQIGAERLVIHRFDGLGDLVAGIVQHRHVTVCPFCSLAQPAPE